MIKMKYGRVSVTDPSQCAGPASREGFKGNAGLPDAAPPFGCGAQKPEEPGGGVRGEGVGGWVGNGWVTGGGCLTLVGHAKQCSMRCLPGSTGSLDLEGAEVPKPLPPQ